MISIGIAVRRDLMHMVDERAQQTERAAKRLVKSKARRHVYHAMSQQTDGVAYNKMVSLEDAILEEATGAWRETLVLWPSDFDRRALMSLVGKMALESYGECRHTFEDVGRVAQDNLKEFFDKFDVCGMLQ